MSRASPGLLPAPSCDFPGPGPSAPWLRRPGPSGGDHQPMDRAARPAAVTTQRVVRDMECSFSGRPTPGGMNRPDFRFRPLSNLARARNDVCFPALPLHVEADLVVIFGPGRDEQVSDWRRWSQQKDPACVRGRLCRWGHVAGWRPGQSDLREKRREPGVGRPCRLRGAKPASRPLGFISDWYLQSPLSCGFFPQGENDGLP